MTSNIGSEAISKGKRSIGFFTAEGRQSNSYAAMKALVTEELKAYFLPELLNRIDEVVFFRSLENPQVCSSIPTLSNVVEILAWPWTQYYPQTGYHISFSDEEDSECNAGTSEEETCIPQT